MTVRVVSACRFNRLLKVGRLREFLHAVDSRTVHPLILRLVTLVGGLLVAIHWNGCVYIALSQHLGLGSDTWVYGQFASHCS